VLQLKVINKQIRNQSTPLMIQKIETSLNLNHQNKMINIYKNHKKTQNKKIKK